MSSIINDWMPETRSLINSLIAAGAAIVSGNNGEGEDFPFTPDDVDGFLKELTACDEASLFVKTPNSKKSRWMYLVFGNSPGELVCDYTVDPLLDLVTTAHFAKWEGEDQPTTVSKY